MERDDLFAVSPINNFPADGRCKWVYGLEQPGSNWSCCGHKVKIGSSFCEAHHRIVYLPIQEKQKTEAAA